MKLCSYRQRPLYVQIVVGIMIWYRLITLWAVLYQVRHTCVQQTVLAQALIRYGVVPCIAVKTT